MKTETYLKASKLWDELSQIDGCLNALDSTSPCSAPAINFPYCHDLDLIEKVRANSIKFLKARRVQVQKEFDSIK